MNFFYLQNIPFTEKLKFAMVLSILMLQLFLCQYPPEILLQEVSNEFKCCKPIKQSLIKYFVSNRVQE